MRALLGILVLLASCGSREPSRTAERSAVSPSSEAISTKESNALQTDEPSDEETGEEAPAHEPPAAEPDVDIPDFEEPLPEAPCPDTRVHLAHRSVEALPPLLTHAAALRSEDGRHVRVLLADHPIESDSMGRVREPQGHQARFEFDAVRTYRRPLGRGRLRAPGARRGGLTHARIVTEAAYLTFGHRDIGRVELTEVDPERVCGRIELDDGFGRVRGAFTAAVVGSFGEVFSAPAEGTPARARAR